MDVKGVSESDINSQLVKYEEDFISFQSKISTFRQTNPNQFIAFANGKILSTGNSVVEVKEDLIRKGIEPSGTVIEFVAKDEIRMII